MKKILIGIICLCFFLPLCINAQVIQHQISDDGHVHIPLQFGFPYYGRIFTDSYMFSNGVVAFGSINNSWCCSGFDLANTRGYQFDFAIMPLQTDLLNYSGKFLTEGTPQFQRYVWENISEFGSPNNLNTFGLEIRPNGFIGMYYEKVNISPNRIITIGMTGDTSKGEYTQHYHGAGYSTNQPFSHITESTGNQCLTNPLFSPTCSGYQEAYLAQQCGISSLYSPQCPNYAQAYLEQQCGLNPLYDRSCQGYEQAYTNQQCSLNPLFATTCTGYQEAYTAQQCGLNALYSTSCSGYQQAYLNQQCGLNPLYATTCTGYQQAYQNQQCGLNPLYGTTCSGYAQAYLNQQCSINPLYDRTCTGYESAYFNQQCTLNPLYTSGCQGYQTAYFNYQCTQNPLYNNKCNGYAQAYLTQQCNISQLYSPTCPNYQQAYFDNQCKLNPLYNAQCSGYKEAYALANIVPSTTKQTISTNAPSLQVTTTGTVSIDTPIVADATVNEVITKPTAPVMVKSPPPAQQLPQAEKKEDKKEEKKDEKKEVRQVARSISIEPKPVETSIGIMPSIKSADIPKGFDIMDLSHRKLIANLSTIKENSRIRFMMNDSDSRHREMVNGQWNR